MSEHLWLQRIKSEGWLELHRLQLCEDLQDMGSVKEGLFWIISLLLANSSGSLCIPVSNDYSRLRSILEGTLPLEAVDWWLDQAIPFQAESLTGILKEVQSESDVVPFVPLVLKDGYLFFQAHFYYRERFLDSLRRRAGLGGLLSDDAALTGMKEILKDEIALTPEQIYAVLLAASLPLALITGGPGSGKTSTIYAILKLALRSGIHPEEIRIAAPTGRAASRVLESLDRRARNDNSSLQKSKSTSESNDLAESMQRIRSSTIHRLLGVSSTGFYHDQDLPLPARLVIIDELSMVDVTLMGRLLEAIDPGNTTLVLLGDPDQLPSVEAGAVLQDFLRLPGARSGATATASLYSRLADENPGLPANIETEPSFSVFLQGSHRFGGDLMEFATRLRKGELEEASINSIALKGSIHEIQGNGVSFIDSDELSLTELLLQWFEDANPSLFGSEMDMMGAFESLNHARILSPVRKGPFGVESVNRACSQIIMDRFSPEGRSGWFSGMPIMLHRNDNVRRLYNGDTGIVGPSGGELLGFFPSLAEGSDENDPRISLRSFQKDALPDHEAAFCHTIHKSQGSEYDVVLVLLGMQSRQSLSRELLYTALTRARKKCILYGKASEIARASRTSLVRETGLSA